MQYARDDNAQSFTRGFRYYSWFPYYGFPFPEGH
jgi:hypothetical protein